MRNKWLMLVPVLAGAALLGACADTPADPDPVALPAQDPLVEKVVAMGFRKDQIVDHGDYFLVEGDIRIDKAALRAAPRTQRVVSTVAANRRNISVNLQAVQAENVSWANATRAAMANWSASQDGGITFFETTGAADVVVSFWWGPTCEAARGSWPAGGAPGTTVSINRSYAGSYSYAQQVWVMTHELGHNVGLAHTNTSDGTAVWGTPASDGASVMNSGAAFPGCPPAAPAWSSLSYYDQLAVRNLYPLPGVTGLGTSTSPSGTVVVSWTAVAGATSYTVQRVEERQVNDYYANYSNTTVTEGDAFTVTGTSFDTGAAYTGSSSCLWVYAWAYDDQSTYFYRVWANFPNGSSAQYVSVWSQDATC